MERPQNRCYLVCGVVAVCGCWGRFVFVERKAVLLALTVGKED